jgi:hypothetical protein
MFIDTVSTLVLHQSVETQNLKMQSLTGVCTVGNLTSREYSKWSIFKLGHCTAIKRGTSEANGAVKFAACILHYSSEDGEVYVRILS